MYSTVPLHQTSFYQFHFTSSTDMELLFPCITEELLTVVKGAVIMSLKSKSWSSRSLITKLNYKILFFLNFLNRKIN